MSKKKEWDGEEFLIGNYQLGYRMVDLYAMPDKLGGHYNLCYDGKHPFMKIGMDYDDVRISHSVLTHEVMEMTMADMDCSFKSMGFEGNASDCRWFFMNHNNFTEIASRSSWFLFNAHADFLAAFKKVSQWKKKQRSSK